MKREELEDQVRKLIGDEVEGFMWNCWDDGKVNGIQIHFTHGILTILPDGDTFKIRLDVAK